jgi:hypothetical protein
VNAKALSTYLGHSSIQTTIDRYGHLMPGNENEAAALVERALEPKCARLENRYRRFRRSRGQIPPPPLHAPKTRKGSGNFGDVQESQSHGNAPPKHAGIS